VRRELLPVVLWTCQRGRGVGASVDIDVQGDVESAGAVLGQADEHQAERLERRGHVQAADIERTQPETLEKC
jgi:hypothetical protein